MKARLSDATASDIKAADHALRRAARALSLAEELHRMAQARYNAAVRAAGFDPETFTLYPDGTAADGAPGR